jgi:D-alanyl-D-alanine carboxypeptidase/D-alanyl-D-alanine-endopeptidase (penicillin-binding protein 4)
MNFFHTGNEQMTTTGKIYGYSFFCVILWLLLFQPNHTYAYGYDSTRTSQFIMNGGYIVQDGSGLNKYREQDLFIPASTLKIFTCLVALEELGKDYRFETHFFLDEKNNLYIKGYGDPFLTSETILEVGQKLAELGVGELGSVFLDESTFALEGESASPENSVNPYDVPNGALAVNFNALPVHITKSDTTPTITTVASGEPQTPLLPMMTEAAASLLPGRHHINVATLPQSGQLAPALRYTGELFIAQFQQAGISVKKGYAKKLVPAGLKPVYIHHSIKSLEEISRACLKYSNNYIANQLFLACGIKFFGLPATWEKSRRAFTLFTANNLQLSQKQIYVQEGSGLSRQNRMSPDALLSILDSFKPYKALLNQKSSILVKSGTMKDVYCYAGYFSRENRLIPYAILLNQPQNNRDKVLHILHTAILQGQLPRVNQ